MIRWFCVVFLSITALSGYAQTVSLESPATQVNLLELYTSEG